MKDELRLLDEILEDLEGKRLELSRMESDHVKAREYQKAAECQQRSAGILSAINLIKAAIVRARRKGE